MTSRLTPDFIKKLRIAYAGITGGPWHLKEGTLTIWAAPEAATQALAKMLYTVRHNELSPCGTLAEAEANAGFILSSRLYFFDALDEIERLRAKVASLREENEAMICKDQSGVIVSNWFDLIKELSIQPGCSLFDTVLSLRDQNAALKEAAGGGCVDANSESFKAGFELARFMAASVAQTAWISCPYGEIADAEVADQLCQYAAGKIRALNAAEIVKAMEQDRVRLIHGDGDTDAPKGIVPTEQEGK